MKSGMENKAKGKLDEVAGKIKQSAGEATNNQSMANRGAAQQVKGHGGAGGGDSEERCRRRAEPQVARGSG